MKLPLLLLLSISALSNICDQPQRRFYMSFPTLSKRDMIPNLFNEINKDVPNYENAYTDNTLAANFRITNVRPQIYYNDHYQVDSFLDVYRANVTMGVLTASTYFNFTITYSNKNKTGNIRAVGNFDPSYFTKNLTVSEGYIEWVADLVPTLTFSNMFHIEFSTPELSKDELSILESMLNGQAGPTRIKQQLTALVNSKYVPLLNDHLNHQKLLSSNNITYTYRNMTFLFYNYVKTLELTNAVSKGLEVDLLFGLESSAENCTQLPVDFEEGQFGGLQELYTFGNIRALLKQGLSKGLYDLTIDKTWEVPGFQFYMGDLGNFVPYANFLPSSDPFTVKCKYNASRADKSLRVLMYDLHDLYVAVPLGCTVNYQGTDVMAVDMDVNTIVRLYGEEESVRVEVLSTGVFNDAYRSIDPKFQITSQYLAKHFIGEVLKGMVGKTVFGHGFPLIKRRYPVIVLSDYMLRVFDPSQP